ncbi:hypothetical protein PHLGIDRAFT_128522 [Phlebiopsis gigantea 11061_1 CR5-6]|uniref:F-box domain-containing protein n=1 Tax=Phlebiopsis gigantea (strain 11061_1 CR5-6) TaxID=745531 RepID=A0A0C3NLX2_PHLG1|nr:hypothetical protein PHLGIDRAFT_128522 [Phlebiopsis gigantea 11061_1 CR5-6]
MEQIAFQEHLREVSSVESRKLPQELCDMVLDAVPTEHLIPCTLVCSSWIYKTAPRLLHDFAWPPKSLETDKEHLKGDSFLRFMQLLAASPRLQCSIRTLRLGPSRHVGFLDKHCILELSILAAIIALCPRLDNLTISECCLRPAPVALQGGMCGRIGTLSLIECSTVLYSDTTGIISALSLFSRIDKLRLGLSGGSVVCPPTTPLPPSLEVGCIESYKPSAPFGYASHLFLRHLCATPSVRASLRRLASGDSLSFRLMECLQQAPAIEDLAYSVCGSALPPLASFPRLRQVTLWASGYGGRSFNWFNAMRDLQEVPPTVTRVAICMSYHYSSFELHRESSALKTLTAQLLFEDWYQLARFLETSAALEVLELRVQCTHCEELLRWNVEAWQDIDPDQVRDVVSDAISCRLSKTAAQRVVVVPVSRFQDEQTNEKLMRISSREAASLLNHVTYRTRLALNMDSSRFTASEWPRMLYADSQEACVHWQQIQCCRLPQELCDIIIAFLPVDHLSSCSLVCKSWLWTATPRLLHSLGWPTRTLKEQNKGLGEDFFPQFRDTLSASPRLQCAIRTLRLGRRSPGTDSNIYTLDVTVLAAIVNLCPHLDVLTLSSCDLSLVESASLDGICGRIGTLSLLSCATSTDTYIATFTDTHIAGPVHALSLFSYIDTLRLYDDNNTIVPLKPFTAPLPVTSFLEVRCVQTYDIHACMQSGGSDIVKHLCKSSFTRAKLLAYASDNYFEPGMLQEMPNLEDFTYGVWAGRTPSFSILPSLRRLTINTDNSDDFTIDWETTMRDLMVTPDSLQHITISLFHPVTLVAPMHEAEAIVKLRAELEGKDWEPLERFLELRPLLSIFEIKVLCIYSDRLYEQDVMGWKSVHHDRAGKVVLELVSRKLSKRAATRVTVTGTSTYQQGETSIHYDVVDVGD